MSGQLMLIQVQIHVPSVMSKKVEAVVPYQEVEVKYSSGKSTGTLIVPSVNRVSLALLYQELVGFHLQKAFYQRRSTGYGVRSMVRFEFSPVPEKGEQDMTTLIQLDLLAQFCQDFTWTAAWAWRNPYFNKEREVVPEKFVLTVEVTGSQRIGRRTKPAAWLHFRNETIEKELPL